MTSFIKIHTVVRSDGRTGQFSSAAYTMPSTALQKSTRTSHPQVATVGGVVCLHLQHHIQNPGPSDRPSSSVHWMTPLSRVAFCIRCTCTQSLSLTFGRGPCLTVLSVCLNHLESTTNRALLLLSRSTMGPPRTVTSKVSAMHPSSRVDRAISAAGFRFGFFDTITPLHFIWSKHRGVPPAHPLPWSRTWTV